MRDGRIFDLMLNVTFVEEDEVVEKTWYINFSTSVLTWYINLSTLFINLLAW